jgi:hypothetical protein
MPKKQRKRALCRTTGKPMYKDRIQADLILQMLEKNRRRPSYELKRSYPCEFCKSWHHTTQEQDRGRRTMSHSA